MFVERLFGVFKRSSLTLIKTFF